MRTTATAGVSLIFGLLGAVVGNWLRNEPPALAAAAIPSTVIAAASSSDESTEGPATAIPPRVYNSAGLAPDEAVAAYVYQSCNRSVANIGTRIGAARGLFGENPTADSGSGFILDTDGHVLTNHHVIENA
jgi:S1-C subfamily serine protease